MLLVSLGVLLLGRDLMGEGWAGELHSGDSARLCLHTASSLVMYGDCTAYRSYCQVDDAARDAAETEGVEAFDLVEL